MREGKSMSSPMHVISEHFRLTALVFSFFSHFFFTWAYGLGHSSDCTAPAPAQPCPIIIRHRPDSRRPTSDARPIRAIEPVFEAPRLGLSLPSPDAPHRPRGKLRAHPTHPRLAPANALERHARGARHAPRRTPRGGLCPAPRVPRRAPAGPAHERAPPGATLHALRRTCGHQRSRRPLCPYLGTPGRHLPRGERIGRQDERTDGPHTHGQRHLAQRVRARDFRPRPGAALDFSWEVVLGVMNMVAIGAV